MSIIERQLYLIKKMNLMRDKIYPSSSLLKAEPYIDPIEAVKSFKETIMIFVFFVFLSILYIWVYFQNFFDIEYSSGLDYYKIQALFPAFVISLFSGFLTIFSNLPKGKFFENVGDNAAVAGVMVSGAFIPFGVLAFPIILPIYLFNFVSFKINKRKFIRKHANFSKIYERKLKMFKDEYNDNLIVIMNNNELLEQVQLQQEKSKTNKTLYSNLIKKINKEQKNAIETQMLLNRATQHLIHNE